MKIDRTVDTKQDSDAIKNEKPKRPYVRPTLVKYGDVASVTRGTAAAGADSGGASA